MNQVTIQKIKGIDYPCKAPFNQSSHFIESPFSEIDPSNKVYSAIRDLFHLMNLDSKNFGSKKWNPLSEVIEPGNKVVLKPNMVFHRNTNGGMAELVTNGSVIRAVCDYIFIALEGKGRVSIVDAPMQSAEFGTISEFLGLDCIKDYYKSYGYNIEIIDLRTKVSRVSPVVKGLVIDTDSETQDPRGYSVVDISEKSALGEISGLSDSFRVTDYDPSTMIQHHSANRHQYLISNTVLESDVVFNLPKIKTHAKAGITCALKNMVGINGSKDWLPHHTKGHEAIGGDEYAKESFMKELLSNLIDRRNSNKDFLPSYLFWSAACQYAKILHSFNKRDDGFFEGSWYGNKTIPRTIADLNWILYYADSEGRIATRPIRKVMIIVDGIVAGEGQGPLSPKRKDLGVLIGGVDPISIDYYVAQIMGFNPNRIPTIRYAEMMNLEIHKNGMLEVAVFEGGKQISLENIIDPFEPARGWKGHIETKVGDSELLT